MNTRPYILLIAALSVASLLPAVVIDNFDNDAQYNTNNLNDLGEWTDDDATLATDNASLGELNLVEAATGYWYSTLGDCYDASAFNTLRFTVRGVAGGETFDINLLDKDTVGNCGAGNTGKQNHVLSVSSYITVSTSNQVVTIPLVDFGVDPTLLFSLSLQNFSSGANLYFDNIELVVQGSPTVTSSHTPYAGSPTPTFTATPTPSGGMAPLQKGSSTWIYGNNATWRSDLQNYDAVVVSDRKMNYLFPYAGWVSIGSSPSTAFNINYNSGPGSGVEYYATALPGSAMYPNIDSGDGAAFRTWSVANMEIAAQSVANLILADPLAQGVHMDIEPFYIEHVAFYTKLRQLLNAGGKRLTMFTGSSNNAAVINSADIVVFSGYDRGTYATPWSPTAYGASLSGAVNQLTSLADANGGHVLIGIPVMSSTTEFESVAGGGCSFTSSGWQQHEYVQAAVDVLKNFECRDSYLGAAFWAFTTNTTWGSAGCTFQRQDVTTQTWNLLKSYPSTNCSGGPTPTAAPEEEQVFNVGEKSLAIAPNPVKHDEINVSFEISAAAARGTYELYTAGYTKILGFDLMPSQLRKGWNQVIVPGALSMANGTYHVLIRVEDDRGARAKARARVYLLH